MHKSKIQNIVNVILIATQCVIYGVFYEKMRVYVGVFILSGMALCLLTRAVIFKSDSSMFISFVLIDICAIMLLNIFKNLAANLFWGYLLIMFAFTTLIVGLLFKRAVYYKIFILLAPIGVICSTYVSISMPLWALISAIIGYLLIYILVLKLRSNNGKI